MFGHLTREYGPLRNSDDEDRMRWVTIPIDSKVFDPDKGNEAALLPTNPEYQPIVLAADDAAHVEMIAEMVTVLRGTG